MKNTEDDSIRDMVKNLYESSVDAVYSLAITGGGVKSVDWLLSVPGASNRILEVVVPYSEPSLTEYLGKSMKKSVSLETALLLAEKAYQEAIHKHSDMNNYIGIGLTASLNTNRFKRSQNKFYMVAKTNKMVLGYCVIFRKGLRDRISEDNTTSRAVVSLMYEAAGLNNDIDINLTNQDKIIKYSNLESFIEKFFEGEINYVYVDPTGLASDSLDFVGGIIPGSFNPLHQGHIGMMKSGLKVLKDTNVIFELSVSNVDKPDFDRKELLCRISQFEGLFGIIITRSPMFIEKSRLFPGCKFIVGIDTMERILDKKYYQSEKDFTDTFSEFSRLSTNFLVAGRTGSDGIFKSLNDIKIDKNFESLISEIPESDFRIDISSKDLR